MKLRRWIQLGVAAGAAALFGCGETSSTSPTGGASVCCRCLVNASCIEPDEYEFCKDTLAAGGVIRTSLALSCDREQCFEADKCERREPASEGGSGGASGGGGGSSGGPDGSNAAGRFQLLVLSADYEERNWDGFGSYAPDPFVVIRVDGARVGRTETIRDTFAPEWSRSVDITLSPASEIELVFYDEDIAVDDVAGVYVVDDLPGAIRAGGRSIAVTGADITALSFAIERL